MLKHRSHSVSISNLQKSLSKQLLKFQPKKSVQFVPFCKERHLGKIIQSKVTQKANKKFTDTQLLELVNFKNFKKMYNGLNKIQTDKYALLTRTPQQKNMFDPHLWKPSNQTLQTKKSIQLSNVLNKSKSNILKKFKSVEKFEPKSYQNRFQKIDVQLYKKITNSRPPQNNPQLDQMFQNYINICQMNQNIRRQKLVSKKKQFIFE